MAKILIGITLLALLALHPSVSCAQTIDGIAATVNEELITTLELDKECLQLQKELERLSSPEKVDRKEALNRLVDKKLIDQKIRELDVKVGEDEVRSAIEDVKKQNNLTQEALVAALAGQGLGYEAYKTQMKEQLERLKLMSQEVRGKVQVSEREMRDYYDQNRAKYGVEEQFRARHIFFKMDKKGGAEELARTEALANRVLKEAREGKDFAELARKYSTDAAAAKDGGDLGTFRKADMLPEIGETVAGMKNGDISAPVLSPAGMHIIKLEERSPSAGKPFDEVKGAIEDILYKKKTDDRFNQWVKELHTSAVIDIK